MKKGVKILIIFMLLIIVGLTTYIAVDKLVLSKDKVEKKENNVVETNEVVGQEEKNENVDEIILTEINKKEFLSNNGIKEEYVGTLEYCAIKTNDNPIYIVLVDYQVEGEAGHGNIFQATYKEGKVNFDKIEDHKYISDVIAYDSNKEILKLSAEYHGGVRTNYFKLSNGKFEEIDLTVADGSKEYDFKELKTTKIETTKRTTNKEISKDDYSEYLGMWEDGFGDVEIKNVGNGYITFSYNIIRLGGIDEATVPFSNGKGIFYFHGYSDSNYNDVKEDNEYYYKKGTIELKDKTVVINIEDVTHEELNKNLELDKSNIMSGAIYVSGHTFTEKNK